MSEQWHVFSANLQDQPAVLRLLQEARRSFVAFGSEDLRQLLAQGVCVAATSLADYRRAGPLRLAAFAAVAPGQAGWAFLRGLAIANDWRTQDGLTTVLDGVYARLRSLGAHTLGVYATELWLPPTLSRFGFATLDWIVTLERHPRPPTAAQPSQATLRSVSSSDLARLAALDEAVFDPPYRLASGELIELMVTSGFFTVAEAEGALLGYVCADATGDEGHIIRLAVHPAAQRRGIGAALLNAALVYCGQQSIRAVLVNTQDSNAASLALYAQAGFRRMGRRIPLLIQQVAR